MAKMSIAVQLNDDQAYSEDFNYPEETQNNATHYLRKWLTIKDFPVQKMKNPGHTEKTDITDEQQNEGDTQTTNRITELKKL